MTAPLGILIVDDSPEDRHAYVRFLQSAPDPGFTFLEAELGEGGLDLCGSGVDCVLLDYHLPDMEAPEFLEQLRARRGDDAPAVVVLTGKGSEAIAVEAMKGGAQDYIAKGSISRTVLRGALRHAIERAELERSLRRHTAELEREVGDRQRAERALQQMYSELERLVAERTRELSDANERLKTEIVERERIQREREELLARERESNRMKDEFLATVSHELRTPLNAMLGWARLLRSGKLDTAMRERALETLERNALAQARLIDDLLEVSRIITGKLRLELVSVELADVIDAAIKVVQPSAEAKQIRLELMPGPPPGPVLGDPDRLQQVLWNLLSNAVKFTPLGGCVSVRVFRSAESVEIAISDTGVGISPEFLPHVFERLRQADGSTTRVHGGLGLGLAIVKHLVELHGGAVVAESGGLDQGATFRVTIPSAAGTVRSQSRSSPATAAAAAAEAGAQCLAGIRILVAGDEPDARELLAAIVRQYGGEAIVAASANDAIRIAAARQPDLLVADLGAGAGEVWRVAESLRDVAVGPLGRFGAVAVTASARAEDQMLALRAGFDATVPSPVDVPHFAEVLAEVARRVRQMV